jgi:hypothetical protein
VSAFFGLLSDSISILACFGFWDDAAGVGTVVELGVIAARTFSLLFVRGARLRARMGGGVLPLLGGFVPGSACFVLLRFFWLAFSLWRLCFSLLFLCSCMCGDVLASLVP